MKTRQSSTAALIPLIAALAAVGAQLRFTLGPIPFTLQNTAVALAGLLLRPPQALLSMLLYLGLIAIGLPLASGFRGGFPTLFGYTAGYLWGFAVSAPLISVLARAYLKSRGRRLWETSVADRVVLTLLVTLGMAPTYLLGFLVFAHYALPDTGLYNWSQEAAQYAGFAGLEGKGLVFAASVLIFLPQDTLMDHPLAVALGASLSRKLWERGVLE